MHYLLSIIPALLNNIMKSNVITVVHGVIQFPPTFIAQAKVWFYRTWISYAAPCYRTVLTTYVQIQTNLLH